MPVVDSAGSQGASEVQSTRESPTIPQREAASPESVPVTDQPVTNVMSEEGSVTLAEVTPSQTPTDAGRIDHLCCYVQSKVPAHGSLFPLWSAGNSSEEPSETKRASSQPVPEVSTTIVEQEPAKADPMEAPMEAPTEAAQTDDAPAEATPAEATPAEATMAEATQAEATQAEAIHAEATPAEATPAEVTSLDSDPSGNRKISTYSTEQEKKKVHFVVNYATGR